MAKRYPGLYPKVHQFDNLYRAFRHAAKGKRGHPDVAAFEWELEHNLLVLQHRLREFTYTPGAYRSFYIEDPKHRLISAAPFRDRVARVDWVNKLTQHKYIQNVGLRYANPVS